MMTSLLVKLSKVDDEKLRCPNSDTESWGDGSWDMPESDDNPGQDSWPKLVELPVEQAVFRLRLPHSSSNAGTCQEYAVACDQCASEYWQSAGQASAGRTPPLDRALRIRLLQLSDRNAHQRHPLELA